VFRAVFIFWDKINSNTDACHLCIFISTLVNKCLQTDEILVISV